MISRTVSPFFDGAEALRESFEQRVGPHRSADPDRFVWDYWHVPERYTYVRTHARRVFPPALYSRFVARLRGWGEAALGCSRISEPWLSYYVGGCRQELHTDVVQGTWAFVFSLTRWDDRRFTGGETVLARPALLGYWREFDSSRPLEQDALMERVPALFNQLIVFDARVPHGVARVGGTRDPIESRVAIHGWFLPATLSVKGGLGVAAVRDAIAPVAAAWTRAVEARGWIGGTTWRMSVDRRGEVVRCELVVDNLVAPEGGPVAEVVEEARQRLSEIRFPPSDRDTAVVFALTAEAR